MVRKIIFRNYYIYIKSAFVYAQIYMFKCLIVIFFFMVCVYNVSMTLSVLAAYVSKYDKQI